MNSYHSIHRILLLLLQLLPLWWSCNTTIYNNVDAFSIFQKPMRRRRRQRQAAHAFIMSHDITETESNMTTTSSSSSTIDNRPFVQRVSGPRPARRLNHAFQHLYRHDNNNSTIATTTTNAMEYLMQYYVSRDTVLKMNQTFPPLLTLSVKGQLHPKMKFLQDTILKLSSSSSSSTSTTTSSSSSRAEELRFLLLQHDDCMIPPQFFGARLERTLAPRHAFLIHAGLPHGRDLFFSTLQQQQRAQLQNHDDDDHSSPNTTHTTSRPRRPRFSKWHDFLAAQRNSKRFAALCQSWQQQQQQQQQKTSQVDVVYPIITFQQVEAFDAVFSRGLMAAARNEWKPISSSSSSSTTSSLSLHNAKEQQQKNNNDDASSSSSWWPWQHLHKNLTSAQILELLIQHGANPKERDYRGATLLHWAAGTGNLPAVQVLLKWTSDATTCNSDSDHTDTTDDTKKKKNDDDDNNGVWAITTRDGATPLHWAAAGASAREFGTGGHVDVCRYLLDQVTAMTTTTTSSMTRARLRKDYVNQQTFDGNSALMWAAWSGSLDIVKLLVRESCADGSNMTADLAVTKNRNGCTIAHWAASGGNLDVCRYLHETARVDFTQANHAGNTPLTHAVAFGRANVVAWLKETVLLVTAAVGSNNNDNAANNDNCSNNSRDDDDDDMMVIQLAQNFVQWTNGKDHGRQQVLDIFQDW